MSTKNHRGFFRQAYESMILAREQQAAQIVDHALKLYGEQTLSRIKAR